MTNISYKKRRHQERQCAMKTRYQTKRKALRKKGAVPYGKGMSAYLCTYCGWWHLGHSTKRPNT